jgi:ADP-heptose:LPS heptosyltransferase
MSEQFTILILQMGGLGDLVLVSQLIISLRKNFPDSRIVLACRIPFVAVTGLFPSPPDETIGLTFNPYAWVVPTKDVYVELAPVIERLRQVHPGLLIAAECQPTWFSWFVAALVKPQRAISAGRSNRPRNLLSTVLEHYALPERDFEGPRVARDVHEIQRYWQIVTFLNGTPVATVPWSLPDNVAEASSAKMAELGIKAGEYLVCFPLGAPGTTLKRWSRENFCQALTEVRREHKLPVLLTGERSEEEQLRAFSQGLQSSDGLVATFHGGAEDIPMLAGLIAQSRAYLGSDTGPMHLAGAYSVNGVTIYGGGTWPWYGPWGNGSIGIVHPLPCFGCNWDCLFGHGICVESIPIKPVTDALRQALLSPGSPARVQTLDLVPASSLILISDANKRYTEAEVDRGERLGSIIELQRFINARDARIEDLEKTAAERLEALEIQGTALNQLRKEAQRRVEGMVELTELLELRDRRIKELEQTSSERLIELQRASKVMDQMKVQLKVRLENSSAYRAKDSQVRDLEKVAADRLEELKQAAMIMQDLRVRIENNPLYRAKEAQLRQMEQIAAERLQDLRTLDRSLADIRFQADRREMGMRDLTAIVHSRDKRIAELERISRERLKSLEMLDEAYKELQLEADRRVSGLIELNGIIQERDTQISDLERIAEERLSALLSTDRTLKEVRARLEATERESAERLEALMGSEAIINHRTALLDQAEKDARERLEALVAADAILKQVSARLQGIEQESEERLNALLQTDPVAHDLATRVHHAEDAHNDSVTASGQGHSNELISDPAEVDAKIHELSAQISEMEARIEQETATAAVLREKARIYESRMAKLEAERKRQQDRIAALESEGLYEHFIRRNRGRQSNPVSRN